MMTKPSLKEECRLKVMDEKCLSDPFRISLGGLYARKMRDRLLRQTNSSIADAAVQKLLCGKIVILKNFKAQTE